MTGVTQKALRALLTNPTSGNLITTDEARRGGIAFALVLSAMAVLSVGLAVAL